eukprot:Unigene14507_Nuclearia_a/m.43713 Unigene14507_Nuclearia_a/g.43713  ORF Unigene14507_Nuclearia_a/g.43713 Unigene14507_Nuclearia_a/m.43713 type:complete len:204 (-) Unigene14507_Nuclearia_a:26-637(-)
MALALLDDFREDSVAGEAREAVDSFLDRLAYLIKQAKDQLLFIDDARIHNESVLNRMIFNPALPDDILVRVSIMNERVGREFARPSALRSHGPVRPSAQVFLQAYALHFTTAAAASQLRVSLRDRFTSFMLVPGRTLCVAHARARPLTAHANDSSLNGQPVEVLDSAEIELVMTALKQTLGAMNAAYDHCFWLLEKIRMFSSI